MVTLYKKMSRMSNQKILILQVCLLHVSRYIINLTQIKSTSQLCISEVISRCESYGYRNTGDSKVSKEQLLVVLWTQNPVCRDVLKYIQKTKERHLILCGRIGTGLVYCKKINLREVTLLRSSFEKRQELDHTKSLLHEIIYYI